MMFASRKIPFAVGAVAFALLVAAGWTGCGEAEGAEARSNVTERSSSHGDLNVPEEPAPSFEHEVQRGETLWEIARSYDIPIEDIMDLNGFDPRQARSIEAGDVVRIPGEEPAALNEEDPEAMSAADGEANGSANDEETGESPEEIEAHSGETDAESDALDAEAATPRPPIDTRNGAWHELAIGETLWDLSRLYDKPLGDILERNHLTDDQVRSLRPGDRVFIPGARPAQVRRVTRERQQQRGGVHHTLESGQTIWDLARIYHVSVAEIMAANQLGTRQVSSLRDGRRLFIPGVGRGISTDGPPQRRLTRRQLRALNYARRLGLGDRNAASLLLRGQVRRNWIRAAGGADRLPGTLRWPVTNGRFVRGYGSGDSGYHLATDIAGNVGWNVRASAPGVVGYSGNELRGFGNIVMVIHAGGWVTLYAHNSVNFVVAGERVRTGTILAEVGSTGRSQGPHVHFELIHDGENCDPLHLWRPGVRHRDTLTRPSPLMWRHPRRRPEAIRCAPRRRHPESVENETLPPG